MTYLLDVLQDAIRFPLVEGVQSVESDDSHLGWLPNFQGTADYLFLFPRATTIT